MLLCVQLTWLVLRSICLRQSGNTSMHITLQHTCIISQISKNSLMDIEKVLCMEESIWWKVWCSIETDLWPKSGSWSGDPPRKRNLCCDVYCNWKCFSGALRRVSHGLRKVCEEKRVSCHKATESRLFGFSSICWALQMSERQQLKVCIYFLNIWVTI